MVIDGNGEGTFDELRQVRREGVRKGLRLPQSGWEWLLRSLQEGKLTPRRFTILCVRSLLFLYRRGCRPERTFLCSGWPIRKLVVEKELL